MTALTLGLSLPACGLTGRHMIGPTLDTDGRVGILYSVAVGPMVGCARNVALPVHASLGATNAGIDDSHLAYELGLGADWIPSVARHASHLELQQADAQLRPAAARPAPGAEATGAAASEDPAGSGRPAAPTLEGSTVLGLRVGAKLGYLRHGDATAFALGIEGAVAYPLARRHVALGVAAGCDALAAVLSDDAPVARCRLSLLLDLTNTHAFSSDTYY